MAVISRRQARNRVYQQQGRVFGSVNGLAHRRYVARYAGRGFVVHHANGLDGVLGVGFQARFNQVGFHAMSPDFNAGVGHDFGFKAQPCSELLPQGGKVAGFIHQHMVTSAQRVDQCRLPCTGARGRVNDDRLLGLKDFFDVCQHLQAQHTELRAAMVNGWVAHGPQNAVWHRRWAGNLQKMSARGMKVKRQHDDVLLK